MSDWQDQQHYTRAEVQAIFDSALKQHASTINLKSRRVPLEYRDIVDSALTRLGYRFRLVSLNYALINKGKSPFLELNSMWSNDGVAPVYHFYTLAFRLVDENGKVISEGTTKSDIRRWLPGQYHVRYRLPLPEMLAEGRYFIEVAMLDETGIPRIRFANVGVVNNNWYRVSDLFIK